jgi:cell division protein FtsQ
VTTTVDRGPIADPDDEPRGRRRGRWLVGAGVVAIVLVLGWVVAFSPVLGARQVSVRGAHQLSTGTVLDAAQVRHGAPLIRLDTGAVARRVEALPEVASAQVAISYPSSVVITVVERQAVGYLDQGTGKFTLVDRTGDQFRTVTATPTGLPRFDVPAGASGRATGQAVAVVAGALDGSVRAALSAIQAADPTSITLQLRDGRSVNWGDDQNSPLKAKLLLVLLEQPGTFFDVSNPQAVYAR